MTPAPTRRQMDPDADIGDVRVRKAADVPVAPRIKRSKYEDLIDRAARLTPGQVLEIEVKDAGDLEKARGRIAAMVRRMAQPLTVHRLSTKVTAAGTIGVYCEAP